MIKLFTHTLSNTGILCAGEPDEDWIELGPVHFTVHKDGSISACDGFGEPIEGWVGIPAQREA
jgi:hypothetical protein